MSQVGEYVKFHMVQPKTECVGSAFSYKTHLTRPHPALILALPHVNMCTHTHNVHMHSQHTHAYTCMHTTRAHVHISHLSTQSYIYTACVRTQGFRRVTNIISERGISGPRVQKTQVKPSNIHCAGETCQSPQLSPTVTSVQMRMEA